MKDDLMQKNQLADTGIRPPKKKYQGGKTVFKDYSK